MIRQIIDHVGDDHRREGVIETPKRVVASWNELYSGYAQDPADVLKTFDADNYDQIVLLKDCELYSMCEHHMLPFFGKAHIAYIPGDKNRVVGISKLARLLDVYARRMQIQERICQQVTRALMLHLQPKGAACIIEAKHMCMCMRGVNKQNTIMVTSSLEGAFFGSSAARAELMQLIKG